MIHFISQPQQGVAFDGNGWELFWECLRYYQHRPQEAMSKDFIAMLPTIITIHI